MNDSTRRTSAGRRLLLAAAVLAGMLVVAECVVRVALSEPVSIRFLQDTDELKQLQLNRFSDLLVSDPDRFWRLAPNSRLPETDTAMDADSRGAFFGVISNGLGFREDHQLADSKPDGEFRILFLGDSCTFGYGVGCNETFVADSENRLNEQYADRHFECINAGVPGYSLYQGFRVLDVDGPRVQPDLVVACFGFNDRAEWDGQSDLDHAALSPPDWLATSHLAGRIWQLGHLPTPRPTGRPKPRVSPNEYRGLLTRIRKRTRQLKSRLVLISWCERFQVTDGRDERTPWQFELHRFARRQNVPLLDLVPHMQNWATPETDQELGQTTGSELFIDIVHVTPATHSRIAGQLVETLRPLLAPTESQ
jgi:lysophospholipase L1-like esterase